MGKMTALQEATARWKEMAFVLRGDPRVDRKAAELAAASDALLAESMRVLEAAKARAQATRLGRNPLDAG